MSLQLVYFLGVNTGEYTMHGSYGLCFSGSIIFNNIPAKEKKAPKTRNPPTAFISGFPPFILKDSGITWGVMLLQSILGFAMPERRLLEG